MNTPMFEQYRTLKAQHPDAVLFFRMGDFYETFFEDAEIAARELELTLTSRNRHDPVPVPMAGVPHHTAAGYIQRLVDAGYRVALADQVEDPALAKGLVRREVVRVVTPGVVYDPSALEARSANWLVAVARGREGFGLAFLDASTGELRTTTVGQAIHARAELERLVPREALLGPEVRREDLGDALHGTVVSTVAPDAWDPDAARTELAGFDPGTLSEVATAACGVAVRYARERLGGRLGNVHAVETYRAEAFMVVDETSRRNLEITRTMMAGSRKGTLLALLDRAATAMGSRMLADWLAFPLLDGVAIARRQSAVAELVDDGARRSDLRAALAEVADVERIAARVAQGTAHARDLAGLRRSLAAVPRVAALSTGPALGRHRPDDALPELLADLERTLVDDPPLSLTEGGLVRSGVSGELDELVRLSLEGVGVLDALEARERDATGIGSLKIRKNNVFGYFLEVTTANLHRVPDRFLRKQTLSNCERYVTEELQELQDKLLGADDRRKKLELELFRALRDRVAEASARLLALAKRLAALDALAALAEVAVRWRWTRPEVDDGLGMTIAGGRHPTVEAALEADGERFVPNDLVLDPDGKRLVVLTGPNMAGKSTVLRQVALVALLAQTGSFVPAESARVGLCDRIFTRVGAADDLRRGRSTFMVEMAETAAILSEATARSLVVLDEIGRGTSTYDGLAIAWAVAEDLHDRIGCRALFATHYHELVELASARPHVANLQVAVGETGGEIVFLRRLKEGGASRSYGIQCAKLAGLPAAVVARATQLLGRFEKAAVSPSERVQLTLFDRAPPAPELHHAPEARPDPLRDALAEVDPDALSPRDALALVYRLKAKV